MIKYEELHEQLKELLKYGIGSRVELIYFEIIKERDDYLVLAAQLCHPECKVTVKLAGPQTSYPCQFDQIAAIYQLVNQRCEIPIPEVIALDISYQKWPWRYLITTYLAGEEWATTRLHMDVDQRRRAYRQIGEIVAIIHSQQFPIFGEITVDGSVLAKTPFLEALKERASARIFDTNLYQLFLSTLERYDHLFDNVNDACLCHEDLHHYNILFSQGQGGWVLSGILDFDKAWSGHHEIDLARMEFWRGMTTQDFWNAYQEKISISPMYQQRKLIYQLLWCLEFAQSTEEHIKDTQEVCLQLGVDFPGFPKMEHFNMNNRQ
jgi:fructosamine-3-kinase